MKSSVLSYEDFKQFIQGGHLEQSLSHTESLIFFTLSNWKCYHFVHGLIGVKIIGRFENSFLGFSLLYVC